MNFKEGVGWRENSFHLGGHKIAIDANQCGHMFSTQNFHSIQLPAMLKSITVMKDIAIIWSPIPMLFFPLTKYVTSMDFPSCNFIEMVLTIIQEESPMCCNE